MVWYKELFKFVAGAAAWDGLIALWCLIARDYPIRFFWISFNQAWLFVALFVDTALVVVLSCLAWCKKKPKSKKRR